MRTNIFIRADGTILNPNQNNLIADSQIDGDAASSLFNNQVTIACYNNYKIAPNGLYLPDRSSVVKAGLSGTIKFEAFPYEDSPYAVDISPNDTIDISTSSILTWVGITESLNLTCTGITGCAYINILVDRN